MSRILVVDDHAVNREYLVMLLGYRDHEMLEAADGAEALEQARRQHPDLIIADILMPTMDGYELVRQLRVEPEIGATPVIFYTATYLESEAQQLAASCGVAHVVIKPAEPAHLLRVVAEALAGGAEPPPALDVEEFEQEHLRLVTDKLASVSDDLGTASRRLGALIDINLQFASQRHPLRLLDDLCRAARALIGAKYGLLAVGNRESPAVHHCATAGMDAATAHKIKPEALDRGRVGTAYTERRAVRMTIPGSDPAAAGLPAGHPPARSLLAAPIVSLENTYGWICLTGRMGMDGFSEEDEKILSILAAQAGRIYENGRLYMEVRESEERFRQIAENIHEVFFLVDPALTTLLYISPAYEDVWGRTVETAYENPKGWTEAVHPQDLRLVMSNLDVIIRTGRSDCEYRIVRPDGAVRWIHERCFPIHDESGRLYRVAGIAEDITEYRRAIDAFQASERRFREMLGNIQLISTMLDTEACITWCNNYLLGLTGWSREEVIGKNWFDMFIGPGDSSARSVFQDLLEDTPSAWHNESGVMTRSGHRRLIRWNNTLLRDAEGHVTGVASIGEDITARRQSEDRIRRLNRVYVVLSGINSAIVRIRDQQALFEETCRILVDEGDFEMAWIGLLDLATLAIRPVARRGPAGDYQVATGIDFSTDEHTPGGHTLVGAAVREQKPMFSNDLADNGSLRPVLRQLVDRGYRSALALPLSSEEAAVGVLVLYSKEPGVFDDEEMKLLDELAGDVSFALDYIRNEKQVKYLAFHDPLTGLANRSMLHRRLTELTESAKRRDQPFALLLVNINNFGDINNTLGHVNGDRLLKEIAGRISGSLWESDVVACLGGDEFAILLSRLGELKDIDVVTGKISNALRRPFMLEDLPISVEARIGIALYPEHGDSADLLWQHAGVAVRAAKDMHRMYSFYTADIDHYDPVQLALLGGLRDAMDENELVLHYQPKIDLRRNRVHGVEALLRWQHPERGLLFPDAFIRLAERTSLIDPLTMWVLANALRQIHFWHKNGIDLDLSVNLSVRNLQDPEVVAQILDMAQSSRVPVEKLTLEITESAIMSDPEHSRAVLTALDEAGIRLSMDDFGMGQSSLTYLKDLPIRHMKIDKSFIMRFREGHNAAIVRSAIDLGHNLELSVTAEGIEDEETCRTLRDLGCDNGQGYYFSKALPADQLVTWLRTSGWNGAQS